MLQSLAILYVEHALARKIKYYKKVSAILQTESPVDRWLCNRLLGVVRSTGALLRACSWNVQTVQLHRELNKYVIGAGANPTGVGRLGKSPPENLRK